MSALYFTSRFFSEVVGEQWDVHIKAKTLTAGNDTEIKLTKQGFKLRYDKGKDTKIGELKKSNVIIGFIVENATDAATLNTILTTDEGEFYIEITRGSSNVLFWAGWIKPAYDNYKDESYPYVVNVKATDSLGRLLNKYNNSVTTASSSDFQDLYYPLKLFVDTFDLSSLPQPTDASGTGNVISFFKWWAGNLTYSTGTNAMRKIVYNRNGFVPDQANHPGVIDSYLTEFRGVLKSFGLKVIYSDGYYYLVQDNSYDVDGYYWQSAAASGGTEVRTSSGSHFSDVEIDNSVEITSTKAKIKAGATFTLEPELNSVRARYLKGHTFANFDPSNSYSSLTTIGFLNQGQTQINLTFNAILTEKWAASAVTPHANQGGYMTGFLQCKLKVGTKYLNGNGTIGAASTMGWEWSTDSNSTFILATGFGVNNSQAWQIQLEQLGLVTSYVEDSPTGFDTAKSSILVPNMSLPLLSSSDYGEVQFSMAGAIYYWQLPSTSLVYGEMNIMDLVYGMDGTALTTYGMPSSTGLQVGVNTPATRTIELISSPFVSAITDGNITSIDNPMGTTYISGQNPATAAIDKSLGDVPLGNIANEDSSIHTLRLYSGSTYLGTGGFDIDTGTSFKDTTQLLVNEYLKVSNKPTTILQATILSHSYRPTKTLTYQSTIGGADEKYIFIAGTFTAAKDEWSGTWYKLDKASITPTETEEVITTIPENEITGGAEFSIPNPMPVPTDYATNLGQKLFMKSNVVGILTTALSANTAYTQISVGGLLAPIVSGQKLIICDEVGGNPLGITTTNKSATGGGTIDVSFTTRVGYAVGSKILVCSYDAAGVKSIIAGTNVTISPTGGTGDVTINASGGGSTSPAGSDTQVQFNNSGSFGASGELTFDGTILTTTVLLATDTDESPTAQVALEDADGNRIAQLARLGSGGNAHVGQLVLRDNATAKIQLKASGSSYINSSNAKLGIGNSSPTKELDVTGDAIISGDLTVEGTLTVITDVKILPSDFIADDVGRPLMIDDSTGDRWLESHSTAKMYASVQIPTGTKATQLIIYGSGTSAITVYEADITTDSVTSKGTGNIGTLLNFTDVVANGSNYLLIELAQTATEKVYGGKVSIA